MELTSLIPQFGGVLYTLIAFVVALSIIVAVHEFGHYIVGRWSGIHAEVFSLGFGPVLFSRVDRRGTRWQVAALPFGGYVRFLGDANAASGMDADAMARAADDPAHLRRTMHGAPLWARAATVLAGPVFNFILSVVVFAAIFLFRGVASDPLTVGEIHPLPQGAYELKAGDEILEIAGVEVPKFKPEDGESADWLAFRESLPDLAGLDYLVRRDGSEMQVEGPYLYPPMVGSVAPRSAASDIGLEPGDVITSIDGDEVWSFDALKDKVEGSDGKVLLLKVWRAGETLDFALAPRRTDEPQAEGGFKTNWRIGVVSEMAFEPATESPGFFEAIWGAMVQVRDIVVTSISGLWHMITGAISTCNMSGPIGIAETSGDMAAQGTASFISFIAVLSTAVGLLNLFPVPALDGGHLMFYAYEAAAGRPPNETALRVLMSVGITAILALMAFALLNDVIC